MLLRLCHIALILVGFVQMSKAHTLLPQQDKKQAGVSTQQNPAATLAAGWDNSEIDRYELESAEEDDDHEQDDLIDHFNRLHWVHCIDGTHYCNTFYFIKISLYNYLVLRRLLI